MIECPAAVTDEPPLEMLEARICELAGHLAAATCRFLLLVGDFDARRGWATWDMPSCSAWLAWKCQVAPGTAREQVRVARALRGLPVIRAEFAAGRMSYAKVRALTRIAEPRTEAGLAELAGPMTAAQLERFVAAHRTVTREDDAAARAMRRLIWRTEEDGQLTISVRLPAAEGAVVLRALRAAEGDLEHPRSGTSEPAAGPETAAATEPATGPASLADALVQVASAYLGGKVEGADNADIYQVIVHLGAGTLGDQPPGEPPGHPAETSRCHLEDGQAISPATAQRIACRATVSWILHDHQGNVLDVGRRHRRPSPALRRAVRERDGYRCQYPGCNSRRVDIHHILPWALGGRTRLENLLSLCEAHHVIVHERGYQITAGQDQFTVRRADGTLVPASPGLPGGDGDLGTRHDATVTAGTIIPAGLGDRMDLHQTIWACFANARLAA